MIIVGLALLIGIGIAIYEWRSKKVLLKHDLRQNRGEAAHVQSERIRAEGVALQNPSSGYY